MSKIILTALFAVSHFMPSLASALPYNNGIVTVGDREFFVGELTDSYAENARSFNFRHAPWLEEVLDNDPVLFNQDVRFFLAGVPAPDLVGDVSSRLREQDRLEDDPLYMAPGHDVAVRGAERHVHLPDKLIR